MSPAWWLAADLYWPAVACVFLSSLGSVLLLLAAARNSPPLLLTAGSIAAFTIATGLAALFPSGPAAFASGLVTACGFIVQLLMQLSIGAPLLYAALVGVSAVANAMRMLLLDCNTDEARTPGGSSTLSAGTDDRRSRAKRRASF